MEEKRASQSTGNPGTGPNPTESIPMTIRRWFQDRKRDRLVVESLVDTVEPKIKWARGYRKRLIRPVRKCRDHCRNIVSMIPGPIYMKRSDLYADPLIRAAFIGSKRLEELLSKSDDALLKTETVVSQERVALLTMTRMDRTTLGKSSHGGLIVGDEKLRSTTFSDHKIVGLAETLEESRKNLEKVILEIIFESAAHEFAARKENYGELKERKQRLQAMRKIFNSNSQAKRLFGLHYSGEETNLEKVESMINETEKDLSAARQGNETPKDWLIFLESYLSAPEKIVDLNLVSLRLDWRNVLTEEQDEKANTITFAQCSLSEEVIRDAVLISYTKY